MPKQEDRLYPSAVSIANTISDYRSGEIAKPTAEHVLRWSTQFPNESREGLLSGLDHVFKQTYTSKSDIVGFIKGVPQPNTFTGADPEAFWRAANILDIQGGGNSQRDMRGLLGDVLRSELNICLNDYRSPAGAVVYLDDVIFSGNRVVMDCRK